MESGRAETQGRFLFLDVSVFDITCTFVHALTGLWNQDSQSSPCTMFATCQGELDLGETARDDDGPTGANPGPGTKGGGVE
jgi:hypothetical protein